MQQDTTDLANLDLGGEIEFVPAEVEKQAASVMTGSAFLPRLQINGATSELVGGGKLKVGTFGLVWNKDKFKELGAEVRFLAISLRNKALVIPGGAENPIAYYDTTSDDFNRVRDKADEGGMNGHMYGPEFLVWVPEANTFALFFHSSKTLRNVAPDILAEMKKSGKTRPAPIRGQTKFIVGKKNKWWGYTAYPESTPLPSPTSETWQEDLIRELRKFNNPPKSEVELADKPTSTTADGEERTR